MGLASNKAMFRVIYRSAKRGRTYLHVEKKDDFSYVPDELIRDFGTPQMTVLLSLDGYKKLVNADLEKAIQVLSERGYYLQLPSPSESLLRKYLVRQGK